MLVTGTEGIEVALFDRIRTAWRGFRVMSSILCRKGVSLKHLALLHKCVSSGVWCRV